MATVLGLSVILLKIASLMHGAVPAAAAPEPLWAPVAVGAPAPAPAPAAEPTPWPKVRRILDLETLWEVPEAPRGVLFVAHGCNHAASDFWPASPRCPHCLGFPEERQVRLTALERGYAVVAVSSYERELKCWQNSGVESEDLERLPSILRQVMSEEGLDGLPLFFFGASSGGGIVLRLAQIMAEVQGVIAQIVPARPSLLEAQGGRRFPPVLFVHMAQRDPGWAKEIRKALDYCRQEGIPADEIKVDPEPVTLQLLRRSPLIDDSLAADILATLYAGNFTDEEGNLLADPRSGNGRWVQRALKPVVGDMSTQARGLHVVQLLNVAYAQHELTGSSIGVSLDWLEAGGTISVQSLPA